MNTILLVEDEHSVANLIIKGLEEDGYKIIHRVDGISAMELLDEEQINLVILDILLPKMNGLEVCRKIRELGYSDLPILMLTALGSAENVVLGLDSGADDYLSKPFKLIELKARLRTLLRRVENSETSKPKDGNSYSFLDVEINDYSKTVTRNSQEILLTPTEYRLLLMFMKNPNRVISRTDLLDEVWGINFDIGTNVVDVYVNYIRKKLERNGGDRIIHTVVGMGYALRDDK
ncbi:response regulator transcription factor [Aequorivita echinoideorum]|uniref:Response regulator transcription factor n=1 Tax=Aequorivita echinoideorum TaxID=1549647 RepID=A0ABS5S0S5_9FLAO|nr:response regulator transcription factor [Aequorivita echinoideorum]MBT0606818.1 response regulator transcription factor [Aequorivita echinoideorum]